MWWFPPEKMVWHAHLKALMFLSVVSEIHFWVAGRQQSEVLHPQILMSPGQYRGFPNSFAVLCVEFLLFRKRKKKKKKERKKHFSGLE
jgi:hypothetical protein